MGFQRKFVEPGRNTPPSEGCGYGCSFRRGRVWRPHSPGQNPCRGRVSRPFFHCDPPRAALRALVRNEDSLHRTKAPSDEGKRSAVAVVNGCPVDSQSRDRAVRRRLDFAKQKTGGENNLIFSLPPSALRAATSLIRGRLWLGANPGEGLGCGGDREVSGGQWPPLQTVSPIPCRGGHWPPEIYDHYRR